MNLEYENRIRSGQRMAGLREAGASSGNVDKLYSLIDKAITAVQKAQSAVLDAADAMDPILLEATAIGGKIATIVPSHIKMHMSNLANLADQNLGQIANSESGQSSLNKLKDLIGSIPYRDIRPQTPEERRQGVALQPNLAAGPQSQIAEEMELEEFYRNTLNEQAKNAYDDKVFSFDKLKESQVFGQQFESDMMESLNMKMAAPISVKQVRETTRAAAEEAMFEDVDLDQLQEGKLDFSKMKAFAGSDGMPLKFDSLSSGGHLV